MEFFFVEGDLRVRYFVHVRVFDVGVKRKLLADDLELTILRKFAIYSSKNIGYWEHLTWCNILGFPVVFCLNFCRPKQTWFACKFCNFCLKFCNPRLASFTLLEKCRCSNSIPNLVNSGVGALNRMWWVIQRYCSVYFPLEVSAEYLVPELIICSFILSKKQHVMWLIVTSCFVMSKMHLTNEVLTLSSHTMREVLWVVSSFLVLVLQSDMKCSPAFPSCHLTMLGIH